MGAGVGASVAGAGVGVVVMAPSPESFFPFPWPPASPFLAISSTFSLANKESLILSPLLARRDTQCELNKPRIVLPRSSIPSINNMKHNAKYFILR